MPVSMPVLEGSELIAAVRRVIETNPDRHEQDIYLHVPAWDNSVEPGWLSASASELARFAYEPYPDVAAMPEGYCQTTACVAGWAAILGAPEFTRLTAMGNLIYPDGTEEHISWFAEQAMHLGPDTADWLFAGYRDRRQILAALEYLTSQPHAPIGDVMRFVREKLSA